MSLRPDRSIGDYFLNSLDALSYFRYLSARMFDHLLDASTWFTLRPADITGLSGKIVFGFFVLLFVSGIVSRIVAAHKMSDRYLRQLAESISTLLLTMGFLGLLFYFFSFERIQLFGARFWYVLWLIGLIVWIVFLIHLGFKKIPNLREKEIVREQLRKYFPPRRRKR